MEPEELSLVCLVQRIPGAEQKEGEGGRHAVGIEQHITGVSGRGHFGFAVSVEVGHRRWAAKLCAEGVGAKGLYPRTGITDEGLKCPPLVPPAWLEHTTYGLGNRRSIHLSYGGRTYGIFLPSRM